MQIIVGCIVLNYNTAKMTIKNVDLLLDNNESVVVVIVDNCSTENDYEVLLQYYGNKEYVDVVQSGNNGGYSKGNNIGIRYLLKKYPSIGYISIMNPDVRCEEKDLLSKLVFRLKNDSNMAFIAPLMIENDRINLYKIGWKLPTFRELFVSKMFLLGKVMGLHREQPIYITSDRILKYDTVQGSFFVIKRSIFEAVGLFDENVFMYSEENILGAKIKKKYSSAYAGVDLSLSYIHEHVSSNKTLRQRRKIIKRQFDSERYYMDQYSKMGLFKRNAIKIAGCIYRNIEIPLMFYFKKLRNLE